MVNNLFFITGGYKMSLWLLKTEPDDFSIEDLKQEGKSMWDGVRNFKANKYIREMKDGDKVFIYHTGNERKIVGVGVVVGESYPDPTSENPKFHAIDIGYLSHLKQAVTLKKIKADSFFEDWDLVRISRLSVMPVKAEFWEKILSLANGNNLINQ